MWIFEDAAEACYLVDTLCFQECWAVCNEDKHWTCWKAMAAWHRNFTFQHSQALLNLWLQMQPQMSQAKIVWNPCHFSRLVQWNTRCKWYKWENNSRRVQNNQNLKMIRTGVGTHASGQLVWMEYSAGTVSMLWIVSPGTTCVWHCLSIYYIYIHTPYINKWINICIYIYICVLFSLSVRLPWRWKSTPCRASRSLDIVGRWLLLDFFLDFACATMPVNLCKNAFLQLGTDLPFESVCIYLHLFARCVAVPWVVLVLANWNQLSREFQVKLSRPRKWRQLRFRWVPNSRGGTAAVLSVSSCDRRCRWDLSAKAANGLRLNGVELLGCQLKAGQKKLPESASVFVRFCVKQNCQRIINQIKRQGWCAYPLHSLCNVSLHRKFPAPGWQTKGLHRARSRPLWARKEWDNTIYETFCDTLYYAFCDWDEDLFSCLSQNDNVMLW